MRLWGGGERGGGIGLAELAVQVDEFHGGAGQG
jgi:hypothetical protein